MINYEKYGLAPFGPVPNYRQIEWLERERTIFFHFGMNTFTDKEWGDGTESPSQFNPSELDIEQWIKAIVDGGFGCAILTAKHHDGFCLWPSEYTEHSIKNSPYKNGKGDIVREFVDACHKYGVKAGLYLSPWDRHEHTWGSDSYNDFYVGQLTELVTNYGELWELWWDGAGSTEAVYDWERWAKVLRENQPNAVVFGSLGATPWVDVRWVGNESGFAGKPCYSTIDPSSLVYEITSELNAGKLGGERFIPAEVDVSIRPGWFYHKSEDDKVRTPENLLDIWFKSNGSNAGLLLNLPPDRRGLIHENDVLSLKEFNKRLTHALENNLAKGKIYASSERLGCETCNLISEDKSLVFAPIDSDLEPEITLELENEVEINAFMIREAMELGQRVTGYTLSALVDGEFQTLCQGKCIGNRLCERFEPVKAKAIKLKITSTLHVPVLRELGLYYFD